MLDLKVGVVKGVSEQIDIETGEIGIHSTPAVVGDIVTSVEGEGSTFVLRLPISIDAASASQPDGTSEGAA